MNTNGPAQVPGGAVGVAHTPTVNDAATLTLNDAQQSAARPGRRAVTRGPGAASYRLAWLPTVHA